MFAFCILAFIGAVASRSAPLIDFTPVNQFTLQLLENVHAFEENFGTKNIALSPVSVWSIFALLAEGSSGDTFTELVTALRLPKDLRKTQCLHTAAKSVLKSDYQDVIVKGQSYMFTECSTKVHDDFCQSALLYDMSIYSSETNNATELAHDINVHICYATDGRILNAVKPSDLENLRMVLIDALYFKANWTHPFDSTQTKIEAFYNSQGRQIGSVNMMYHKAPHYTGDSDELGAQILEMTYGNNEEFSMLILLPYEGVSIKTLLNNLATKSQNWMQEFRIEGNLPAIDTFIPRFKLSSRLDLIPPMRYTGIHSIFDKEKAKLPGVADNPLFVSSSIQNVELEVTEEGTVAASSTVVGLEDRILGQRFEANKEFVFMILQRSCNLILFAGVYGDPSVV
ncbi:serine protease inhibitor-like [Anticarsia gemmatalis]|uniref:serine protease inhibitor-like n=1 Tax=Anticarsia gemmatalis TaxID=129554 RepID=UPI003F76203D